MGKKIFDLSDSDLMLIDTFFTKAESDHYYHTLLNTTAWREYEMEIFDKTVKAPRMIAWYEDKDNIGANQNGPDWTTELLAIRQRVEQETTLTFNGTTESLS
ncbi:hypothetical protein LZQ00_11040 [Sphingobacterium sp. SRCM116780]|uniref:hypothetical protein n=1 Tax=Sphingobacterium sp. SRCM116780 TaxID=2907623 RepID=UPI001F28D2C6|nr:hypothetical protein [Sphingobacterium sp. SRCM116780]UIR54812.1 hypothetical protein LZQ00_11040 [Sphingobacterium sp. SRCM116780]